MKKFSSIHEFRLLTFLLSLALLLGVSALTITEADAGKNNKKLILAKTNQQPSTLITLKKIYQKQPQGKI